MLLLLLIFRCRDLQKYVLDKEDSWVLDRALLKFVGDVLRSISSETKVRIMRVLAVCALKESFVAFLHQVRRCVVGNIHKNVCSTFFCVSLRLSQYYFTHICVMLL